MIVRHWEILIASLLTAGSLKLYENICITTQGGFVIAFKSWFNNIVPKTLIFCLELQQNAIWFIILLRHFWVILIQPLYNIWSQSMNDIMIHSTKNSENTLKLNPQKTVISCIDIIHALYMVQFYIFFCLRSVTLWISLVFISFGFCSLYSPKNILESRLPC